MPPKYKSLFYKDGGYCLPFHYTPYTTFHEKLTRHNINQYNQYATYFKSEEGSQIIFDTESEYKNHIEQTLEKRFANLKLRLTPQQLYTLLGYGFERAYTGEYYSCNDVGIYACRVCTQNVFMSDHKFNSKDGYANFWGFIPMALAKRKHQDRDIVICSCVI